LRDIGLLQGRLWRISEGLRWRRGSRGSRERSLSRGIGESTFADADRRVAPAHVQALGLRIPASSDLDAALPDGTA